MLRLASTLSIAVRKDVTYAQEALPVRIKLVAVKSNRSAIGARLIAKVGDMTLRRMVQRGTSYCSQPELPITLGLAGQPEIAALEVQWALRHHHPTRAPEGGTEGHHPRGGRPRLREPLGWGPSDHAPSPQ